MSQPKSLHHWTNQIKSVFTNLSKPQSEVLAAFSFGAAKAKSRALNAIARELPLLGIPSAVETRLRRFISNDLIDMAQSCENLAMSVIRALPQKEPVIVLVDETGLHDRLAQALIPPVFVLAGFRVMGRASCQNQDLRDYRIFRIRPARLWSASASSRPYSYLASAEADCRRNSFLTSLSSL